MIGILVGIAVGYFAFGPDAVLYGAVVGAVIQMACESWARSLDAGYASLKSIQDYGKAIPRVGGVAYGPIIDSRSPACAYCGRPGSLYSNCAGCGAQVGA